MEAKGAKRGNVMKWYVAMCWREERRRRNIVSSFLHVHHLKFPDVQLSSVVDKTSSNPNHISVSSPTTAITLHYIC
eukprot:scaffold2237_cov175-Ochromonas_danica.AAC.20